MVSVAMATYNGERYIKEQIESILLNLGEDDELVISDDGSTDRTIYFIEQFRDRRIRIIEGPRKGLVKNFEHAIANCSGDYIFLSDQDDIWEKGKVDRVLPYFREAHYILVQHDAVIVDGAGNVLFPSFANMRRVRTGLLKNLIRNTYHGCCIAFKKELVQEILPFPDNIYLHDEWIGLIAELNGRTIFIEDNLLKYRRHGENVSQFEHHTLRVMFIHRLNYSVAIMKYLKMSIFWGKRRRK